MPLTYRQQFLKKYNLPPDSHLSVSEIAKLTGVPKKALDEVAKRGAGAWASNLASVRLKKDFSKNPDTKAFPRSERLSQEQWKMARIYSFVLHGKTWRTADKDLAEKYQV